MFVPEEELPVEVAKIDGVKIYNMDLTEASEDEVLEEFTADASSTDHQYARLCSCCQLSQIEEARAVN